MLKNKLFLYGLGLGLMIGAALLQLMFKAGATAQADVTAERLQAQAEQLNYKLVPKEQPIYAESDIEAIKRAAAEAERNRLAAQSSASPPTVKTVRVVYVSERMDASQVADMFVKAGLLSEPSALTSQLRERKLTTKIKSGLYSFEEPPSIDDIIAAVTIQP